MTELNFSTSLLTGASPSKSDKDAAFSTSRLCKDNVSLSTTWSIVGAILTTDVIGIYGFKLILESDADLIGNRTEAGKLLSSNALCVQYQGVNKVGNTLTLPKNASVFEV